MYNGTSTTSKPNPNAGASGDDSGTDAAVLAAAIVGGIVGLVALVLGAALLKKKHQSHGGKVRHQARQGTEHEKKPFIVFLLIGITLPLPNCMSRSSPEPVFRTSTTLR